jgi:hypothetical protein
LKNSPTFWKRAGGEIWSKYTLRFAGRPRHESCRMADTTTFEIIGDAEYRVFADGWWADVECRWDRNTGNWRVAVLDTNAYGRIAVADIAMAANQAVGMGEVPADRLVWLDTGGRIIHGEREW